MTDNDFISIPICIAWDDWRLLPERIRKFFAS